MVNLINPVSTITNFAMKAYMRTISNSSNEIATGIRSRDNRVDYVIGTKLRDNTIILKSVVKAAAYGINMLRTAESTLISMSGKLTNLKKIIAQANTAHGELLEKLNLLYKDGVRDILRLIGSAEFNGRKLFDGLFAGPGVNVIAEDMPQLPLVVGPLAIRVGESITNNILITIPKLLAGKANIANQRVEGRFTPLFPISPAIAAAVVAVEPILPNLALNWNQLLALNPNGDPIRTIIYDVAKRAGIAAGGNPGGGVAAGMIVRAGYLAARSEAKLIAGGNLLNTNEQLAANNIIDNALNIVANQMASIGGQMRSLQQAIGDINISIRVQSEAGDSYLNTNYEEATKNFKTALLAMRGAMSITGQGYLASEAALALITE